MAETIDQQFIEYIVKALVGNPDAVKIDRTIDEKGVLLELHVQPEDLGRVIGRNGATAKSIRTLLRALGVKNDARYNLKIVDTNGGGRREERRDEYSSDSAPAAPPATDEPSDQPADEPVVADEPAAPVEEPEQVASAEEEKKDDSGLDRHREDLKELTDLDI